MKIDIEDWGLITYESAWKKQLAYFNELVDSKQVGKNYSNKIILCEHPHVYTLGKSGKENNLLVSTEMLNQLGASFFHIDRGGDITYHGPGQIVCYPIINLNDFQISLREYIYILEQSVIEVCEQFGIRAIRNEGATGVWLSADNKTFSKICAIGVRCSHFITMHGLALNVNTNLDYFHYINPCGFVNRGVTSISKELHREMSMDDVKKLLIDQLVKNLNAKL